MAAATASNKIMPAGGAGEEAFNTLFLTHGPIRYIPYSLIEDAVKEGKPMESGSTGAARLITVRGKQMIYKSGRPGNVANEYIAYQLFEAMGARVPASYLVVNVFAGGIPMAVLIEYLPGAISAKDAIQTMGTASKMELRLAIESDFLYHALLLNWDAKNWENHLVLPAKISIKSTAKYDVSHPYTIDMGGALFYRAMGEPKTKGDLSDFEILEFRTMPEMSQHTHAKFFVALTKSSILFRKVCTKAATIDDEKIMSVVEGLRPLFGYLPAHADLPELLRGRLEYLRKYCRGEVDPFLINNSAIRIEYKLSPLNDNESHVNIATKRLAAAHATLAESATTPLRMRGKREIAEPSEILEENLERFNVKALDDDNAPVGVYPQPYFTIKFDRTTESERLRHAILASREDPAIDAWLREQVAFIESLSQRDTDILTSYTRNGDVLVNNYLRGTLREDVTDLVRASLETTYDNPHRPVVLAYSIYDQFRTVATKGFKKNLLNAEGNVDMEVIRDFMLDNLGYFGRATNLAPLIEQYKQELVSILERAPRPPHAFTVFRGLHSESHQSQLDFKTIDFFSTSISPNAALKFFTEKLEDKKRATIQPYRCCIYELEVARNVPCIYMQSVSEFHGEFEILMAPGLQVTLEPIVRLKIAVEHEGGPLTIDDLWHLFHKESSRLTKIGVVEGSVRKATAVPRITADVAIGDEENVLEVKSKAAAPERFASQKPRSQVVGRNRTRRAKGRNKWRNNNTRKRVSEYPVNSNKN